MHQVMNMIKRGQLALLGKRSNCKKQPPPHLCQVSSHLHNEVSALSHQMEEAIEKTVEDTKYADLMMKNSLRRYRPHVILEMHHLLIWTIGKTGPIGIILILLS